jgi:hypothetical protein
VSPAQNVKRAEERADCLTGLQVAYNINSSCLNITTKAVALPTTIDEAQNNVICARAHTYRTGPAHPAMAAPILVVHLLRPGRLLFVPGFTPLPAVGLLPRTRCYVCGWGFFELLNRLNYDIRPLEVWVEVK